MNVGKHKIVVEATPHGRRCAVCHVPLLVDKVGYYHSPQLKYAAPPR